MTPKGAKWGLEVGILRVKRHEGLGYSLLGSDTAVCGMSVGKKRSYSGVIAELHRRNYNGICYLNTILHFIFWVAAYCRVFILCKTVKNPAGRGLAGRVDLITRYV